MARRIEGNGFTIIDRSQDYLRAAENQVERVIAATTIKVQAEAKRLLNLKGYPPASIPGEAPAKRTGTLARSIDQETVERKKQFIGRVGTNIKYGFWLELGTRKMAPRPYLRRALRTGTKKLEDDLKRAYKRIR